MLQRWLLAGISTGRRLRILDSPAPMAPWTPTAAPGMISRSCSTHSDRDLVEVLQSEIMHEQVSDPFENCQYGSLGDFILDSDVSQSQDIVLRRRNGSEEIAVSALLSQHDIQEEEFFPRLALMKVCITKSCISSVLQFDCSIRGVRDTSSKFYVHSVSYLPTPACFTSLYYKGPSYSDLDPSLQTAFKKYLINKGITTEFTSYVLLNLHKNEQRQYMNWLQKLETIVG